MVTPGEPLLRVRHLVQEFTVHGMAGGVVKAVRGVSFDVRAGETLGIVGETGAGKSSLALAMLQAPRPKSGQVLFGGTDLVRLRGRQLTHARRDMQAVFQDPFGSLDPTWRVRQLVAEPLVAHQFGDRAACRQRVDQVLELVGLDPGTHGDRRPGELSGGECQRVAIARAVAPSPSLLICDEPVSSLDVLVQAQVINLFERLRTVLGLSYLFISHDLALVKQVSDRVAVMYLGRMCEVGPTVSIFRRPLHPYTQGLLAAVPRPGFRVAADRTIGGEPPSPIDPPSGCAFRTRCPRARRLCATEDPPPRRIGDNLVACHFPFV